MDLLSEIPERVLVTQRYVMLMFANKTNIIYDKTTQIICRKSIDLDRDFYAVASPRSDILVYKKNDLIILYDLCLEKIVSKIRVSGKDCVRFNHQFNIICSLKMKHINIR